MKVLIALALLIGSNCFAQDFTSPIAIDAGNKVQSRSPEIHVVRGKVYVAYFQGVLNIRFARSVDGGSTFEAPNLVAEGISSNQYNMMLQRAPKFVVDPNGVIHLTWTEDRHMKQGDVWYVRSTDDGKTWTQPMSLSGVNDSMKYAQDFTSIACDSLGNLYVSFLDFRDEARRTSEYGQLYFTKSNNGGLEWSEPKRISYYSSGVGGTCECCKQEIAAGKTGNVYVAYRSNINNLRNIYMVRSLDKGTSWQPAKRVQDEDWEIMACPTQGPSIALDRYENLHMTWRDARNQQDPQGANRVYYDVFDYGTESSFPDREVTPEGENASWPAIAIVDDGKGVWNPQIYYQSASMMGAIKMKRFNGTSFSDATPLVNGNSSSELVSVAASGPNTVHAVWQEAETGSADQGDILYVKTLASSGVRRDTNPKVSTRIESGRLFIDGVDLDEAQYVLYDLLGRKHAFGPVNDDSSLPLPSSPRGVYLLQLTNAGLNISLPINLP